MVQPQQSRGPPVLMTVSPVGTHALLGVPLSAGTPAPAGKSAGTQLGLQLSDAAPLCRRSSFQNRPTLHRGPSRARACLAPRSPSLSPTPWERALWGEAGHPEQPGWDSHEQDSHHTRGQEPLLLSRSTAEVILSFPAGQTCETGALCCCSGFPQTGFELDLGLRVQLLPVSKAPREGSQGQCVKYSEHSRPDRSDLRVMQHL